MGWPSSGSGLGGVTGGEGGVDGDLGDALGPWPGGVGGGDVVEAVEEVAGGEAEAASDADGEGEEFGVDVGQAGQRAASTAVVSGWSGAGTGTVMVSTTGSASAVGQVVRVAVPSP